jgi:hypothetical protein
MMSYVSPELGQRRAEQFVELLRAEASAHDKQTGFSPENP